MTRLKHFLSMTLIASSLVSPAFAIPEDRDKPITGRANSTSIDANSGKTVLVGKVVIRQGLLTIQADKVTMQNDPKTNETQFLVAEGNPVIFTDTPTLDKPSVRVTGQQIEFLVSKDLVITNGDAQITSDNNQASGERIEYNLVTEFMVIEGECALSDNESCDQAEFILQPGKND
ncbi:MAG: lipopolysaccharide transport periplasmic protein LptA [Reinekea sp.]|jgi:lipopolysaccharide export system protein LptA|nr:lipopolysaccharide transport periplasmic protein LptA [Reinekea sp.]